MKIVYCVSQLAHRGGAESKANALVSRFDCEVHILIADQKNRPICYLLDERVIWHDMHVSSLVTKYVVSGLTQDIADKYGLKIIYAAIEARHQAAIKYCDTLRNVEGVTFFGDMLGVRHNYSYFPIFINEEKYGITRDELYFKMKEKNVLGRRYFYPLINTFSTYRGFESANSRNIPNAHKMADSVICLPMHHALSEEDIDRVLECIINK